MPRNHRLLYAEGIQQADYVAEMMQQGIALDLWWCIGLPVAAHIGGDRMKTGCRQFPQLMPPGIPAFGKAVA